MAYASKDRNVYASVAGQARVVKDRARIEEFWSDAYKAYFPQGKDDPDVVLIEVLVRTVEYWEGPGSWIGQSIAFLVARITKRDEVLGDNKVIRVRKGGPRKRTATKKVARRATKKATKATTKKVARKVAKKATKATKATKKAAKKTARKAPAKRTARRV